MKEYKNRVTVEVMLDVYTTSETEDSAAAASEEIGDYIAKFLDASLQKEFAPSEIYMTSYGVRNISVEEIEGE